MILDIAPTAARSGDKTLGDVTRDICADGLPADGLVVGAFSAVAHGADRGRGAVWYQIATGIGTWGLNKTVGWAFDITNFVFWVGIGHAGTLISAVLFLFRQKWRTAVNRSAEAMTLFAVMCAGIFPADSHGPSVAGLLDGALSQYAGSLWVNFKSPLLWDVFAISTYLLISAVFWYVGLIPDLATIRDRSNRSGGSVSRRFSASAGTDRREHWHRYETVYMLLAGLATPLVFSVHTIVSMDFATAVIPGWHTTIFPPYFVAGAIFSGLAMVHDADAHRPQVMQLEDYITLTHIDRMCQLMLSMGCIVGLAYGTEFFMAAYSGNGYEQFVFKNRALGPLAWAYWTMVTCNVWFRNCCGFARLRNAAARLCDRDIRQCRDVVRAIRDHRHEFASRLPAVELGALLSDDRWRSPHSWAASACSSVAF